ncbi:SusD/RagB family nutrient-binding outer membrane lipoprotein [Wenyingzhuangia sp. IMCC45533]
MKLLKKLTYILSLLTLGSCTNDLDINENPNLPREVDKSSVLTAAQSSIATLMGGFLTNYGGFMAQYHTQAPGGTQYLEIESYNVPQNFTNRFWLEAYVGGIKDLDHVIDESKKENDSATFTIAMLLRVYIFQLLTDLHGDIPYAKKLKGLSDLNLKVVSQENIYKDLLLSVDEAMETYEKNPNELSNKNQDIILKGDMNEWLRFANTLKLKLLIRISSTPQANSTEVMKLLSEDNFVSRDIKFDVYEDITNKRNPFADVQLGELNGVNHCASNSLLMFYKNNNDPRISKVYRLVNGNTEFIGLDQGAHRSSSGGELAVLNFSAIHPVFFFTVAESNFLKAEAQLRFNNGLNAKQSYDNGIRASFTNYGLSVSDANVLIQGAYTYSNDPIIENNIRQVMIQKWASLAYVNNIEAYFEQLRTGYPEVIKKGEPPNYTIGNLKVSDLSSLSDESTIPQTMWYPDIEISTNKNLSQKDNLLLKSWWNK